MTAREALEMATLGGAGVLGRDETPAIYFLAHRFTLKGGAQKVREAPLLGVVEAVVQRLGRVREFFQIGGA